MDPTALIDFNVTVDKKSFISPLMTEITESVTSELTLLFHKLLREDCVSDEGKGVPLPGDMKPPPSQIDGDLPPVQPMLTTTNITPRHSENRLKRPLQSPAKPVLKIKKLDLSDGPVQTTTSGEIRSTAGGSQLKLSLWTPMSGSQGTPQSIEIKSNSLSSQEARRKGSVTPTLGGISEEPPSEEPTSQRRKDQSTPRQTTYGARIIDFNDLPSVRDSTPASPPTLVDTLVQAPERSLRFETTTTTLPLSPPLSQTPPSSETPTLSQPSREVVRYDLDVLEAQLRKPLEVPDVEGKAIFKHLKTIGNYNSSFICASLTEEDSNKVTVTLYLIDQHAADEKFRFETLNRTTEISVQPLMNPIVLKDLVPQHRQLIHIYGPTVLQANGFRIGFTKEEDNETQSSQVLLHTKPMARGVVLGVSDLEELLSVLATTHNPQCGSSKLVWNFGRIGSLPRPPRLWNILATKACRSAVMFGTPLKHSKMEQILNNLAELDHPWNCPHGRPTTKKVISISLS
eukprot:Blabericola_migrator_1__6966@NODE_352_length_9495_cov_44_513789_g282_i0_p3_GENE_NODE_352_length_9495_cov_44_513789_g282_i0NODE_352_length_9495_cov_44_513789_g282_i0_p3_ORF_typecomplete_len514_score119_05MutL_C/PF08676_11/1_3e25_NODE_352_length_9495_cov_44_513789_g282_i025334074